MAVARLIKRFARRILPQRVVEGLSPAPPFDNGYAWLNHAFSALTKDTRRAQRPQYVWGVVQGAALARVLGVPRISVLEFGVAGGFGLLALESTAYAVARMTGVQIDVVGFDTGVGLPKPEDVRDQPNMWFEGQLPMDQQRLKSALRFAKLRLGPVKETVPSFIAEGAAPVAFVSIDVDLYSSTRDALVLFTSDYGHLLPRVVTYFDDIFGHTYNDFCGERLAIGEFNHAHAQRKISPIHGLRYFLPRSASGELWPDGMHWAHFFEHPSYSTFDSIQKGMFQSIEGESIRRPVDASARRVG